MGKIKTTRRIDDEQVLPLSWFIDRIGKSIHAQSDVREFDGRIVVEDEVHANELCNMYQGGPWFYKFSDYANYVTRLRKDRRSNRLVYHTRKF